MPTEQAANFIAVLCDQHRAPMSEIIMIRFTDIEVEGPAFKCEKPGCTRHFMRDCGYFDAIDGRVLGEKFQQRCPMCSSPMYLYGANTNVETWRCATVGCGQEQRLAS
jgi:hypothetical protein